MPVAVILQPQQGWSSTIQHGRADNIVGHQQAGQQEDTNLASPVRLSAHPLRHKGYPAQEYLYKNWNTSQAGWPTGSGSYCVGKATLS